MKYCLPYNQKTSKSKLIEEADEWTIEYNPQDKTLHEFLEKYKDKRINIFLQDISILNNKLDLDLFININNIYPNTYLELSNFSQLLADKLNENHIRFFFKTYASNWDMLYELLFYNVTDVFITEELGFELDKVSQVTKAKNVQVRVFPNVAQSISKNMSPLKTFFIRPEEISLYEPYVDVCEFYGEKSIITYFNIYKHNQRWSGLLNELIIGFNSDLNNSFLIELSNVRVRCGKRCLKGEACHICDQIERLANNLQKAGLAIHFDKEKNNDKITIKEEGE